MDPHSLRVWLEHTTLSAWVTGPIYVWPVLETLHFIGLSLLIGTIGLFDLRLLGMAKNLSPGLLSRLIPWGMAGFALNVITGILFFVGEPKNYVQNIAFYFKMAFVVLAGINVLVFYLTMARRVEGLGPGDDAPLGAKAIALASLLLWIGVMSAGRLLTFYHDHGLGQFLE
jgi:uncharacterized membrane protein